MNKLQSHLETDIHTSENDSQQDTSSMQSFAFLKHFELLMYMIV